MVKVLPAEELVYLLAVKEPELVHVLLDRDLCLRFGQSIVRRYKNKEGRTLG